MKAVQHVSIIPAIDVSNVLAIFLLVTLLAGIWVYFRSDVTKKTVKHLSDLAEALEKRVDALESERDNLLSRIDVLEKENQVLRSLVSGENKALELMEMGRDHHLQVMDLLQDIKSKLHN